MFKIKSILKDNLSNKLKKKLDKVERDCEQGLLMVEDIDNLLCDLYNVVYDLGECAGYSDGYDACEFDIGDYGG
jgi:hypothetical protein